MEQHPIPQDVTGFQFKLIGTMTVKQFGYVAAGAILAVLFWYAPASNIFWQLLFKIILVPFFGILGIIVAFVPIEGRPVDVMAANFLHALFTPNQYIYIKRGKKFTFASINLPKAQPIEQQTSQIQKSAEQTIIENQKEKQLRVLLSSSYKDARTNLDKREIAFLESISSMPLPAVQPIPQQQAHPPAGTKIPLSTKPNTQTQKTSPQTADNTQHPVNQAIINELSSSHQKILELQQQTSDIHAQKEHAEQELIKLKNQLSAQKTAIVPGNLPQEQITAKPTHAYNIPQNMLQKTGFSHLPDTPNVIMGIIKDPRGNILPNILVEVKDTNGNPVRAFKTNPLGQFASATPLPAGSYTIELEDPKKQHVFDVISITAENQIMLPIEIISHDAREELRKALFN